MKIGRDEVRRIAVLANLEFDAEGETRMAEEMSRTLDYVDQLRLAPAEHDADVTPIAPVRLRDDRPGESLPSEVVAAAAPRFERGQFVVPKVIGSE